MKESKYNYHFQDGDQTILYNGLTNALAKMNKNDFQKFEDYVSGNQNGIDEALEKSLKYGGYIIDDNINELDVVRHQVFASRFSSSVMNLTIAPTSNCNFRCPYCYEKDVLRSSKMSDETQNGIIEFIKKQIKHLESLNVTWYGGEPLLELGRILSLSSEIIKLCDENDVRYFASIITNGYLLDLETLKKLMNVKVKHIQITLDGPREYHDKRRYRVGKKPTFDHILSNLNSFNEICRVDNFPFLSVRMNVDKNNVKGLEELKNLFSKEPFNQYIYFYIASVYDKSDENNDYTFTPEEFNQIDDVFKKDEIKNFQQLYPIPLGVHCVCDSLNGFVIDSDGSLYKCWEEMGNTDLCIGNISDLDLNVKPKFYYDYLLFDPSKNEKCAQCEVLPVCMGGGCLNRIIRDQYKPNCEDIKCSIHKNIETSYYLMNK